MIQPEALTCVVVVRYPKQNDFGAGLAAAAQVTIPDVRWNSSDAALGQRRRR
jgi:hypothetical protein